MKSIPVQLLLSSLAMLAIASEPSVTQTRATPQTNWREVKALKLGRFRSRVEVSSVRALRIVSQLDTTALVSQEISADSAKRWQALLLSELDKPARLKYVLGNAVMVEPFAATDTAGIGYVLTVADTEGVTRRVVLYRDGMQEFLDMIVKGAAAATYLTDEELARVGPVLEKPIALAKRVNFVYPRNAKLAGLSGSAVVEFVVDTSGKAKPGTITCIQATFKDFADAAEAVVKSMEFIPATLDGHKIEQFVQYPIDFKLNAVLPVKPFPVPTRPGRR
jgi:TonB family protein